MPWPGMTWHDLAWPGYQIIFFLKFLLNLSKFVPGSQFMSHFFQFLKIIKNPQKSQFISFLFERNGIAGISLQHLVYVIMGTLVLNPKDMVGTSLPNPIQNTALTDIYLYFFGWRSQMLQHLDGAGARCPVRHMSGGIFCPGRHLSDWP